MDPDALPTLDALFSPLRMLSLCVTLAWIVALCAWGVLARRRGADGPSSHVVAAGWFLVGLLSGLSG